MTSSPEVSAEKSADPVDSLVLHATDNHVSWITLNRPEALNAITHDQRERLIQHLSHASSDPDVRAVVITATAVVSARARTCAGDRRRGGRRPGGRRPGSGWPVTWPARSDSAPSV